MGSTSSIGAAAMQSSVSQSSQSKRNYLYCIDTRQIVSMMEYSTVMMAVSSKAIEDQVENEDKKMASKTNRQIISELYQRSPQADGDGSLQAQELEQERAEVFCAGNKELVGLSRYINHKLAEARAPGKSSMIRKEGSRLTDKSRAKSPIDFLRIFSLDDKTLINQK